MEIRFSAFEKCFFSRFLRLLGLESILSFRRVYKIWPWSVTMCNHCKTEVWPWQRRGQKRLHIGPYGHTQCVLRKEAERRSKEGHGTA